MLQDEFFIVAYLYLYLFKISIFSGMILIKFFRNLWKLKKSIDSLQLNEYIYIIRNCIVGCSNFYIMYNRV